MRVLALGQQWLRATKKLTWRLTAVAVWLSIVSWLFGSDAFESVSKRLWTGFHQLLIAIDLAPTSLDVLVPVTKVAWVLLITGLGLVDLLVFLLYVLLSPILFLIILPGLAFLKRNRKEPEVQVPASSQRINISRIIAKLPYLKIAIFLGAIWAALFADGRAPIQQYSGV